MVIYKSEYLDTYIIEAITKLQNGDVIIADAAEDETVGKCTELVNVGEETVVSGLHTIPCRPSSIFASGYLGYYMNSPAYHNQLLRLMQGTKVLSISKSALQDTAISYPIDDVEQCKMSKVFQQLDNLITLHHRKYDKLLNIKKAMLEKLFPRNGAEVPEIRVRRFTQAWEQHKLGELSDEFRSGDFIKASDISTSGDYPVYGGNGLRGYTNTYNHDGKYALIGRQGALCGNMKYASGKAYFTEHAVAVRANDRNITSFLYHLFGIMNLGQYSGQSAQPGLAVSNLTELKTMVPVKAEQIKIAALFCYLDNLITLQQQKLDKLKNVKKSCIEKMFV